MSVRPTRQPAYDNTVSHKPASDKFRVPAAVLTEPPSANKPGLPEEDAVTFDSLTPVEQAAASLGVDPNSLQPIQWLNSAHYESLKKKQMFDPTLARRIEAFKTVSSAPGSTPAP